MRFWLVMLLLLTLGCREAARAQAQAQYQSRSPSQSRSLGAVEYPDVLQNAGVKRVRCIFKDSRGFIWIGTENGLCRFDGSNVDLLQHDADSPLALPHNTISTITEDKSGQIWVGTMQGVARVDAQTLACSTYSKLNGKLAEDFDTKVLVSRDGRVWVGSSGGLSVLEGGRFMSVWQGEPGAAGHDRYINGLVQWRGDTLALTTFDGLVLFDMRSGGFVRLELGLDHPTVTRAYVDERGRLWLGTWAHGCVVLDSSGRGSRQFQWEEPVKGKVVNIVTGFAETDYRGVRRFWVSTLEGVYLLEEAGEGFREVRVSDVESEWITADEQQYIWSAGMTVSRFFAGKSAFSLLQTDVKGLVTWIQPFHAGSREAVAFSSWYVPGGLTITNLDGTRVLYRRPKAASADAGNVDGIARDSLGRIWVSSLAGVGVLGSNFRPIRHGDSVFRGADRLLSPRTNGVLILHDTAWILFYRKGISLYDLNFHRLHTYLKDDGSGLVDDVINNLFADRSGRLWLGGDNRLYRFDGRTGRFIAYNFNVDGSAFHVQDLDQLPDGDLVVCTASGLYRFTPSTGASMKIRSPLITDNNIQAAAVDAGGDIWFINREHLIYYNVSNGHFTLFGNEDGLDIHDNLENLATVDGEHFYLAGGERIFCYDRSSLRAAVKPIKLYLHSIQVNDSTLPRSSCLRPLNLDYMQGKITVEFGAINYVKPEQNLYAYMLTPVDDKWNYTNRNYTSYANLSPGRYVFTLKAQNYAGVWSDAISMPVTIRPPYWATWWFRLVSGVFVCAAVFFSVRYVVQRNLRERILRLQQEQAVEKERNRIARDMHDDLGSGLTKIAILSEVTKAQLAVPGAALTNLDVISNASRELVDNLQNIVWVLNPRNDSLNSLLLYIKEHVEGFFEPVGIAYSMESEGVDRNIPLSEEKRRNIFLSVKESCNNILKYAACTEVRISVTVLADRLLIVIRDDGVGFQPEEVGPFSNGLKNMRNRMEQIGARFRVVSAVGKGTTVTLEVPV